MKPTIESDGQGNFWIRDGRNLQEVTPVVVIGHVDPDEREAGDHGTGIELHLPVLEDNSAAIDANLTNIKQNTSSIHVSNINPNPIAWDAEGGRISDSNWVPIYPILPVTVVAGGAGAPPATEIIPLIAALRIDVMLFWSVDTVSGANQYIHRFRTDPLAAVGGITPTLPPWAAVQIPQGADTTLPGHTYGARMMTDVVASAFGIAEGVAADWPNAAEVTFWGFYRAVA